jgi:membrane associated rhomboid family serine protease
VTIVIIVVTCFISIAAFGDRTSLLPENLRHGEWYHKFMFNAYGVVHDGQRFRLVSHGFVHTDWTHLIFNMITLYFFGRNVESYFTLLFGNGGVLMYVVFYLTALCASSIPDLIRHRNNSWYNALGASGAVSAVLFAAIFFRPEMSIMFMVVPFSIPGYIYAVLYLAYSAFMAYRGDSQIGHIAHFAGALYGLVFPLLFVWLL